MSLVTRFAPSPTGPLHLGHAFSALTAWDLATRHGGRFLLRIEDIDTSRARPEWEARIYDDLAWLGIGWSEPVLRQSRNMNAYREALGRLRDMGLTYACTCRRRDIEAAASAPQEGTEPVHGPDGLVYPGTCRGAGHAEEGAALRLDMAGALSRLRGIQWKELGNDQAEAFEISHERAMSEIGDIVLARRGMGTSYHLSVVVDDAAQGVTDVVRGRDLAPATPIHVILQHLLDLPRPVYRHHRLIRDDTGKRLAKRDDARSIATYREAGATPDDIRRMVDHAPSGRINSTSSPWRRPV